MLLSLLLTLTPTNPTTLEGFYGRQIQAWFLEQITRYDPDLAQALHTHQGPRPYTLSSLIVPQAGRRGNQGRLHLIPGNECQIRITTLSLPLSELVLTRLITKQGQSLILKGSEFRELRLSVENDWVGQATFQELVDQAGNRTEHSVTLEFASPTAFRSGQVDMPLPTPDQVWRSLWWRWNKFAPPELQIDPVWPKFAATCMVVSDFHLRSMKVLFKKGTKGAATGATGQVTYRLLPERHCGDYAPFLQGAAQVMHTLANFALYSGVGHHTTIGMGQTRRLPNSREIGRRRN